MTEPELTTVDELLAAARAELERLEPPAAQRALSDGAALVDIRSDAQIERDGTIPGASRVARNVMEWRLQPGGEHSDPELARPDRRLVIVCDAGYQSSLAAATLRRLGLEATDLVGGFQAWRGAGLPVSARGY